MVALSRENRFRLAVIALAVLLATTTSWATGRLMGKAVDADGNPIGGVEIKMIPLEEGLPEVKTESKENGKFVFGLLRPAQYRLVAFKDGMRISRIDANLAVPEDDSLWAYHEDVAPGTETPSFVVTGVTQVTYDMVFSPSSADPGLYGTGVPVSGTKAIVDLIQAGSLDEALAELDRTIEAKPDNPTLYYLRGFALKAAGRLDEAAVAARKTLELSSDFEGANVLLAKILEEKGDLDGALSAYQKEQEIAESPEVQRDVYSGLASLYVKKEMLPEAAEALEKLIAVDPSNADAHKELASVYTHLGDSEKAAAAMESLKGMGETDPNILYNLGAERYNAGDLETAAEYFEQAIEVQPEFPDAHRQLAFTQLNLGNREAAIEHLKKFLELNTNEEDQNVQTAQAILQQLTQN